MTEFLGVVELGTLYRDGVELPLPTRPWYSNDFPGGLDKKGDGNTPLFTELPDTSKWIIGNTSSYTTNKLKWIKIKDEDKTLFICDRVILNSISRNDLYRGGYVSGKEITIDGVRYKCRLLTGGSSLRNDSGGYSGGSLPNEWDKYIENLDNINGLPKPNSEDLNTSLSYDDFDGVHNQLWHWWGNRSWCSEGYTSSQGINATYRGYHSARYFGTELDTIRFSHTGWRPVLEVVNNPPTTPSSIMVPEKIYAGKQFTVSWSPSSDPDGDDIEYVFETNPNGKGWSYYQGDKKTSKEVVLTTGVDWTTWQCRVKARDSKGAESGYRTSVVRTVIPNTPPTISGTDSHLGDKNLGFTILYKINDVDTNDTLTVTEKLNNTILRTISGAPKNEDIDINISQEQLFALPLNSTNTIEIKVDDGNGGIAYRRYTFKRVNTTPNISGQNQDLGNKLGPFSVDFTITDVERNSSTVRIYLDDKLKEEYSVEDGKNNIFTITHDDWIRLTLNKHTIKIEATDEHGAKSTRLYTFTRVEDAILFNLKAPITTDAKANKLLISPTWSTPTGSNVKVEVCNNAFDGVPTWENATNAVMSNKPYIFTNTTKTATKWGIDIKFTLSKGTATDNVIIYGFGGAFE